MLFSGSKKNIKFSGWGGWGANVLPRGYYPDIIFKAPVTLSKIVWSDQRQLKNSRMCVATDKSRRYRLVDNKGLYGSAQFSTECHVCTANNNGSVLVGYGLVTYPNPPVGT